MIIGMLLGCVLCSRGVLGVFVLIVMVVELVMVESFSEVWELVCMGVFFCILMCMCIVLLVLLVICMLMILFIIRLVKFILDEMLSLDIFGK